LDVEALCGVKDADGTIIEESPVDTICNSWGDMCVNGVPQIESMCANLDSVPSDLVELGLDWFCCDVSYFCVPEPVASYYDIFGGLDLCGMFPGTCATDATLPSKDNICNMAETLKLDLPDLSEIFDILCGYTNTTDGTVVDSFTQPLCDTWAAACSYDIPSFPFMCEYTYEAPEEFFAVFED